MLAPVIRALLPAADMMVCVARPLTAPRPLTRPLSKPRFMVLFIKQAQVIALSFCSCVTQPVSPHLWSIRPLASIETLHTTCTHTCKRCDREAESERCSQHLLG